MVVKRVLSASIIGLGLISLSTSVFISEEVLKGQKKIANAQKSVDSANSLFESNDYTRPLGRGILGSAREKIEMGQKEIETYSTIAEVLKYAGIALISFGIINALIRFNKKK
jgi:hypothetical protein